MYETPSNVSFFLAKKYLVRPLNILEPSAGTGAIACYFDTLKTDCVEVDENRCRMGESRTTHAIWHNCNFFDFEPKRKYDLIIGNPPYGDAVSNDRFRFTPINFIKKCSELLADDGLIVFLLESDYFRSKNRHEYFKKSGVFLSKKIDIVGRLKFLADGTAMPSASRYHSIYEFSKNTNTINQTVLETIKL